MRRLFIRLNNALVRWRRVRVNPDQMLLLLPHCLHFDGCAHNVVRSLSECRRCGKCSLAGLVEARDVFGVVACVVGGGRQALEHVRRSNVKAVVAVACERELVQGIRMAFPKPVLAISNQTPEGPCRNTVTDVGEVVAAIESLLRQAPSPVRR